MCVVLFRSQFRFTLIFSWPSLRELPVAIAILSGYGGLVVLYKIKSAMSSSKKVPDKAPAAAAAPAPAGEAEAGVPAVDSPAFEKYVESDAFYKLLEDEVQLGKLVESM